MVTLQVKMRLLNPRPVRCSSYLPVDPFQFVGVHCLNGAVYSFITDDSEGEDGTPVDEHKSDPRPTGIPQTSFVDLDSMSGSRTFTSMTSAN